MERDFEECIAKRCEKALGENKDYMEMENRGERPQDELQIIAETLCYIRGWKDAMALK